MNGVKVLDLFDLEKTIAAKVFTDVEYPWDVLNRINDFIMELGETLSEDKFYKQGEDVWIAKSANIYPNVYISGPCIIDEEAEIRTSAFIRGSVIVGKKVVVGNATELKNTILFDEASAPHFNYVGDSVLGYRAHIAAGVILGNVKSDKSNVKIKEAEEVVETKMQKVGAFLGDNVEIGCNSVLCPGTVIGRNSRVYPLSMVRGVVTGNVLYKNMNEIVEIE